MVPLALPMVPMVPFGEPDGITIGTNGFTNGTIGRTLNDIGIHSSYMMSQQECLTHKMADFL